MENNTCYLVCYTYRASYRTTTGLYNIFYSKRIAEKYYQDKLDELRATDSFDSREFLELVEIPINALDRTGLEEYIGRTPSKELTKILADIYPFGMIKQNYLTT